MVFCKNCGKELPSVDSVICPACGVAQREIASTVVSIQTKNSGAATIIALVAGFFGFNGIGHIYIGKTAFGVGIMIIGSWRF
jgi:RNA polymerase subunit RPABC4/transcription elongation factor Spt4